MENIIYRMKVTKIILLLFALCWATAVFAGVEPYQNSIRHLKKGDTLVVQDEKFRNSTYDWASIRNHTVKNIVSLELTYDTTFHIKKDFSCELTCKIEYFSQPGQVKPFVVDHQKLKINYARHAGALSKLLDSYSFSNGHWVKITVQDITCPEMGDTIPPVVQLKSQVVIDRQYAFQAGRQLSIQANIRSGNEDKAAVKSPASPNMASSFDLPTVTSRKIQISWLPIVGAEEYDLEWTAAEVHSDFETTIDAMIQNQAVSVDQAAEIFRNNSTRVTVQQHAYEVSLVYDINIYYILFRMRQVQYVNGIRIEGDWDYKFNQSNQWAVWPIWDQHHEPMLNWQYNASYAEEGKKKEVISYFDGSLRGRQTVTLNNTEDVAIVQENIMDEFSRPLASILPAPVKDNSLHFFRNFNLNNSGKPYNYTNITLLSGSCEISPEPLNFASTAPGASQYYSANNEFKNDPLLAGQLHHKFIPDAEGYPLTVTQYTADNTGRIKLQGGVGKTFQPGTNGITPSKTTKYYYGKPESGELEKLFGSDVGNASHYLKNMVVDPNGQISLSYINSSGKTIATALAGPSPAGLGELASKTAAVSQTVELLNPARFSFDDGSLQISANTTYMASVPGPVTLHYDINKLINSYSKPGFTICSNCYYDLSISIYNDCNTVVYKTQQPVSIGAALADCNAGGTAANDISADFQSAGEYYIRFSLQLSRDVIEDYTNEYIRLRQQNGDMRTEAGFVTDYLNASDFNGCYNDCKTCNASLGTQADFVAAVKKTITDNGVNAGTAFDAWANGLYTALKAQCTALQQTCNLAPCDKVKTDMLADIAPGGQYALFGEDGQPLEKSINILYNHWRDAFPVRESTNADFIKELITTDENGSTTSPYDESFTLPMLIQYWKPEWAEKFLSYHPEYCKLQFCYTNSSYFSWDERLNAFINSANDISNIFGAQPGLHYDRNNGSWLLGSDPFFNQAGSPGLSYKSAMQNDLNNYSQQIMKVTDTRLQNKSATGAIDFLLYCADPAATTNTGTRPDVWNNCAPAESCRVPDREWRMYRDIYLELKDKYYNQARDLACVNSCQVGRPIALPGACASADDFSFSTVDEQIPASPGSTQKQLRISYLGGAVSVPTTVYLYYPAEYQGLPGSIVFNSGEQEKIITIPSNIEFSSLRVKSVYCNAAQNTTGCQFGSATGTLYLPAGSYQSGGDQFTQPGANGGQTYTYTIVSGTQNNQPSGSAYCTNGNVTSNQFYNCYAVYLPGSSIGIHYYNVWVITCTQGTSQPTCEGPSYYADYQFSTTYFHATIGNQGYYLYVFDSAPSGYELCDVSYWSCFTIYAPGGQPLVYNQKWLVVCSASIVSVMSKKDSSVRIAQAAVSGVKATSSSAANCSQSDFIIMSDGGLCSPTTALYHVWVKNEVALCPGQSAFVTIYYGDGSVAGALPFNPGDISKDICLPRTQSGQSAFSVIACGVITGSCATSPAQPGYCNEAYQYKTSRFPVVSPIIPSINSGDDYYAQTQAGLVQNISTACDAKADGWMDKLKAGTLSFTAAQLAALRAALVDVCQKGGDLDHPFGASTVVPGRPAVNNYTSFQDAMKAAIGNADFNMVFNPWLLDAPYPYSPRAQLAEKTIAKTDVATCSRLSALQQQHQATSPGLSFYMYLVARYGTAMTITEAELNMLVQGCGSCRFLLASDLTLPAFLDPAATGAVSKSEYDAAMSSLSAAFGANGLDVTHSNYETVVRNYLNFRWGFSLSYQDYADYQARAAQNADALLINKPAYGSVAADPYDCMNSIISTAVIKARQDYLVYLEAERKAFQASYVNTCRQPGARVRLTATQQAYHYTLYYYDQPGNLVRTVPPEGVSFLNDQQVAQVLEARNGPPQNCSYTGPAANTDKNTTLQWLSNTIAGQGAASIEYWQYNQQGSGGQVMATTPDKKFMYHSCLNGHYLQVQVYSLQQTASTEIELVLSNEATVDVSSQLPLQPWSHIVVQAASLSAGTLSIYMNGSVMPQVQGAPPAGCGWEIAAGADPIQLPENISYLKYLRLYNRLLTSTEIAANAAEPCFGLANAPALTANLLHWGRFNTPSPGSPTLLAEGSSTETRITPIYPNHGLTTSYAYNSLNQVSQQRSPDAGTAYFWYDYLGRLVLSQNAKQHTAGAASYTQFDALSRITEVGARAGAQVPSQPSFLSESAIAQIAATGSKEQITNSYYDVPATGLNGLQPSLQQDNLRKRVSASVYREHAGDPVSQATYYDYDLEGNVKTLYQQVPGLGTKKVEYEYDLVSGKVNFVKYQHGQNDRFYYKYSYDADNKLLEAWSGTEAIVKTQGGSYLLNGQNDAAYNYYLHGPLARMELGQAKVQGMDYAYTLQGWLKGVNSTATTMQYDMGKDGAADGHSTVARDELGYSLNYYPNDYKAVQSGVTPFAAVTGMQPLYNGNIAAMSTNIKALAEPLLYHYGYDQLNRLKSMQAYTGLNLQNNTWTPVATDRYKEQISYDGNGNITSYKRNGNTANPMDDLNYGYIRDGEGRLVNNRLRHVKDAVGDGAYAQDLDNQVDDNYGYDEIGQLVRDNKEGITGVDWTVYGKIKKVTKANQPAIEYLYDATGNRISKTVGSTITRYVRDAQGNVLGVYEQQGGGTVWKEQHLYGSSRLGMWLPNVDIANASGSSVWGLAGAKRYELNNHLGNVLGVVSDEKVYNGSSYDAVVVSAGDYAPFGMGLVGRTYNNGSYRYGFNGKENDPETSTQDYGMRIYDPRVGRFLSTDPLTKGFPMLTPYQYASNSPIANIDMDGLERMHYTYTMSDQGKPQLKAQRTENFTETNWAWKPKTGGTSLGFQLWEKQVTRNPRQEYVLHGTANVSVGLDGTLGEFKEDVTWTFPSYGAMQRALSLDGVEGSGSHLSWLNSDQRTGLGFSVGWYNSLEAEFETGGMRGLWRGAGYLSVSKSYGEVSVKAKGVEVGNGGIGSGGMLELDIDVKKGPGGSKVASGRDVFNAIYSMASEGSPITINGIRAIWTGKDNLSTFNNLIKTKVNKGLMSLEEAALQTFTGKMATEKGFKTVSSINGTQNADGTYRNATVNFTK